MERELYHGFAAPPPVLLEDAVDDDGRCVVAVGIDRTGGGRGIRGICGRSVPPQALREIATAAVAPRVAEAVPEPRLFPPLPAAASAAAGTTATPQPPLKLLLLLGCYCANGRKDAKKRHPGCRWCPLWRPNCRRRHRPFGRHPSCCSCRRCRRHGCRNDHERGFRSLQRCHTERVETRYERPRDA